MRVLKGGTVPPPDKMKIETFFNFMRPLIPKPVFRFFQPAYHWLLAFFAALFYRFPSRELAVIGVTGTKGKSTVVYLTAKIFEEAGVKAAALSSIEFKINDEIIPNEMKMTMPGRFFVQKFLRRAADAGCKYAILEITSEGIRQHRHRFINFDTAIFTNLSPEHVESHGGFENYKKAKLSFFEYAKNVHILNKDAEHFSEFAKVPAEKIISYSKKDIPRFNLKLAGEFNRENAAAAAKIAEISGISPEIIKKTLESIEQIPGRMEEINEGQPFKVVVDYAHTPDSLEKVYQTLLRSLAPKSGKLICVLGAAGGGRDKWKRPEMGKIAAEYCDEIILTNEDPYDEIPFSILEQIEKGFPRIQNPKYEILNYEKIIDRKEAIKKALGKARENDAVIITGKGCEQWMMLANGKKIKWNDREIVKNILSEKPNRFR